MLKECVSKGNVLNSKYGTKLKEREALVAVKSSVADPIGSGTFPCLRIRYYCPDPDPAKNERAEK